MEIKAKIKKLRQSENYLFRSFYSIFLIFWKVWQFLTNKSFRLGIITKLKFNRSYYQHSTFTINNRYPILFRECANYLLKRENPKILSFGCSTGEEVFSISRYIPNSNIVGVDINPWCIKQCLEKDYKKEHTFIHRFSTNFEYQSDFDAIFCMAVFQRTENRTNTDNSKSVGFLFEKFENEISILDQKLKSGGLFIIDHSDYNFMETTCAKKYKPLNFENNQRFYKRPLFNRDNIKISESHNLNRIFIKS